MTLIECEKKSIFFCKSFDNKRYFKVKNTQNGQKFATFIKRESYLYCYSYKAATSFYGHFIELILPKLFNTNTYNPVLLRY